MTKKMFFDKLVIIPVLIMLFGCSNQDADPDFVGYIVRVNNEKMTFVEARKDPFVLIHEHVANLQTGDKVEVHLKEDGVEDIFPSNAPGNFTKIEVSEEENEVLTQLLSEIVRNNGSNYYPAILSVDEGKEKWHVQTFEYDHNQGHSKSVQKEYNISKGSMEINEARPSK